MCWTSNTSHVSLIVFTSTLYFGQPDGDETQLIWQMTTKLKVDSKHREIFMTAIFQSLGKTVLAGVVILVVLLLVASSMGDASNIGSEVSKLFKLI